MEDLFAWNLPWNSKALLILFGGIGEEIYQENNKATNNERKRKWTTMYSILNDFPFVCHSISMQRVLSSSFCYQRGIKWLPSLPFVSRISAQIFYPCFRLSTDASCIWISRYSIAYRLSRPGRFNSSVHLSSRFRNSDWSLRTTTTWRPSMSSAHAGRDILCRSAEMTASWLKNEPMKEKKNRINIILIKGTVREQQYNSHTKQKSVGIGVSLRSLDQRQERETTRAVRSNWFGDFPLFGQTDDLISGLSSFLSCARAEEKLVSSLYILLFSFDDVKTPN